MSDTSYRNYRRWSVGIKITTAEHERLMQIAEERNTTSAQLLRDGLEYILGFNLRDNMTGGNRRHMTRERIIEEFLRHNKGVSFTSADIGKALGYPSRTVGGLVVKLDNVEIIRGTPNMFRYAGGDE